MNARYGGFLRLTIRQWSYRLLIMNPQQELAVKALEAAKSDDQARARMAFGQMSECDLDQPHGNSGLSRRDVLPGYILRDQAIDTAIAWVKSKGD